MDVNRVVEHRNVGLIVKRHYLFLLLFEQLVCLVLRPADTTFWDHSDLTIMRSQFRWNAALLAIAVLVASRRRCGDHIRPPRHRPRKLHRTRPMSMPNNETNTARMQPRLSCLEQRWSFSSSQLPWYSWSRIFVLQTRRKIQCEIGSRPNRQS